MPKTWLARCRAWVSDEIGELVVLGLVAAKLFGGEPAQSAQPAPPVQPARVAGVAPAAQMLVVRAAAAQVAPVPLAHRAAPLAPVAADVRKAAPVVVAVLPDIAREYPDGSTAGTARAPRAPRAPRASAAPRSAERCRVARAHARVASRIQRLHDRSRFGVLVPLHQAPRTAPGPAPRLAKGAPSTIAVAHTSAGAAAVPTRARGVT